MNKYIRLMTFALIVFSGVISAQTITMNIASPDTVWEGDEFNAKVMVTDFTDVGSFQIFVSFDKNKLEVSELPEGIISNTSIITNELDNINETGEVRLVWLKLSGGSIGTGEMISIRFKVKSGIDEGESSLWFSDDYVTDVNGETITTESFGKDIFIYTIPSPVIRIDEVPANPNSEIAVPVMFTDFKYVLGFELSMEYSSTKVEYIKVENILSELNEGLLVYNTNVINDSTKEFAMMWVYDGYTPLNVNQVDTEVFSLVFNYNSEKEVLLEGTDARVILYGEREIVPEYYSGKIINITDIEDDKEIILSENYHLFQNYPNPFNPMTAIGYYVPEASNITVVIYNNIGEVVLKEVLGYQSSGYHEYVFSGSALSSGTYFYQLVADNRMFIKKMSLVK